MYYDGIYINCDNLIKIAYNLKLKINQIEKCYGEVTNKVDEIDGSNEDWQGDEQKDFYDTFELVTNKFDINIRKLYEIYNYLCKIISNYEEEDKAIIKKAEDNTNNLDM